MFFNDNELHEFHELDKFEMNSSLWHAQQIRLIRLIRCYKMNLRTWETWFKIVKTYEVKSTISIFYF